MLLARSIPRASPRLPICLPRHRTSTLLHHLRAVRPLRPHPQLRCYAQSTPKSARSVQEELQRQARAIAKTGKDSSIPERVLIYHAGTGRTTFLAMIKVTTLFLGAFFTFILVPSYIKAEKPPLETAGIAVAGLIPIIFVTFTAAPFVTHIHIHLPPAARASRALLERFVRATDPSSIQLTLTTMSAIGKPRYSSMRAADLVPAPAGRRRFGLVSFVRDVTAENAARRWYMFPAVAKFFVQERVSTVGQLVKPRYQKKAKSVVDEWIWDIVKDKIQKNAALPKGPKAKQ